MYERWTATDDAHLKKVYLTGSKSEIMSALGKEWFPIRRRARRLGLVRPEVLINEDKKKRGTRKDAWTAEEEERLRKVYPNGTKTEILSAMNRPWKGIWSRAYRLGLHRDKSIVRQEVKENMAQRPKPKDSWSDEELNTLKSVYPVESKQNILSKISKPWSTIRFRAWKLGLRRSEEAVKADNVLGTSAACMKKYGVPYTTNLPQMQQKSRETNLEKRGVEYPTQNEGVRDKVRASVQRKYGVSCVFKSEEIKSKIRETNLAKYGVKSPMQNPEIKSNALETAKKNNSFALSDEEASFYALLKTLDPETECQAMNPIVKNNIDFYMPRQNLWVQYDGSYWHGQTLRKEDGPRSEHIAGTMKRDALQNSAIPNLVRFSSIDVKKAQEAGTVQEYVKSRLKEKASFSVPCHQYTKKEELREEDLKTLNFDPTNLKASDFLLSHESYSRDLADFIERYEWLGTIGTTPKWCFTARYNGKLAGAVLINEPTAYSTLLGPDTKTYEALIQRGATASWTPKNLGSRLITFSCKWMVANTFKRAFVGYGDPKAHEVGTIYQACNFDYLGGDFGSGFIYYNPDIKQGMPFSAQSLKRTSAFRRWCRGNNIDLQPGWIRPNGFKDLGSIPEDVKRAWLSSIEKILSESHKIPIGKKHKYVLLLGRDKRELRKLKASRTYVGQPYPKRGADDIGVSATPVFPIFPKPKRNPIRSTRSRITKEKDEFILNNYAKMTKKELALQMKETERWVDSRVRCLIHEGTLTPKNPIGSTKSRSTPAKLDFVRSNAGKMSYKEMAQELNESVRWVKRTVSNLRKSKQPAENKEDKTTS